MSPLYRAEAVSFSMASEPGDGGYLDYISAVTDAADWTALINMAAHLPAGSRSVTFDTATLTVATSGLTVGNYISLGTAATGNQEVRKVASIKPTGTHTGGASATTLTDSAASFITDGIIVGDTVYNTTAGTNGVITGVTATTIVCAALAWANGNTYQFSRGVVYLDYPTGFFHADNDVLDEKTVPNGTLAGDSMVTFLPGVYETITTPDLQPEILPQYFLGTASNRNPYIFLRGRQTFAGSLPNFILLNGYPLRFPVGTVRTVATAVSGGSSTNSAATFRGQRSLPMTDGTSFAAGDYIEIERGGTNPEVRQIISGAGGAGAQTFILNYPMMFAHAAAVTVSECTGGTTFTHTVVETNALDSMTWHVRMKDSSATADTGGISWLYSEASGPTVTNSLTRRWVGGKIGRATIGADEGGMLVMSWDDVPFLDMVHNQRFHSSIGGGATDITRFGAAILNPDAVGGAIPHSGGALGTPALPVTEPYYFSQGSITFFGVEFARIRNFRIEINNNLEPRYYIRDQATNRIPYEFLEQRREYRMTATVALPDVLAANATTRALFKELMLEGNYGSGMAGFDISLVFTRGANDTITITSPPSAATTGGDAQGAYIVRAPHPIGTESPIQADVEMVLRSMSVVVQDQVGVYP